MDNQEKNEIPLSENSGPALPNTKSNRGGFSGFIKRNPVLIAVILGLIAVLVVYFWKDWEGKKQKMAIEKMATELLKQNNQEMLKLMAKPLVWTIRSELLRGNLEQVNMFTADLVKEKNFLFIHLVDPSGNIFISTDKKMEGKSFLGMIDSSLLRTDSVVVVNKADQILTLIAPVMGYDRQLAMMVINYRQEQLITAPGNKPVETEEKMEQE